MRFLSASRQHSRLACFALSPTAQAVVPAPDGGYPVGNTVEGQNALLSLTTGGTDKADAAFDKTLGQLIRSRPRSKSRERKSRK